MSESPHTCVFGCIVSGVHVWVVQAAGGGIAAADGCGGKTWFYAVFPEFGDKVRLLPVVLETVAGAA